MTLNNPGPAYYRWAYPARWGRFYKLPSRGIAEKVFENIKLPLQLADYCLVGGWRPLKANGELVERPFEWFTTRKGWRNLSSP